VFLFSVKGYSRSINHEYPKVYLISSLPCCLDSVCCERCHRSFKLESELEASHFKSNRFASSERFSKTQSILCGKWRTRELHTGECCSSKRMVCTLAIEDLDASLNEARTTLLPRERQAYTDAVNCLMSKPSRIATTDPSIAPGAKSR
jgi:hypothetical protein